MAKRISQHEREDFATYLRQCTNAQVQGVFDKERQAKRRVYANLARDEATRRGIQLNTSPVKRRTFEDTAHH